MPADPTPRGRAMWLVALAALTAVSTWHGVTADRWRYDLAITRFFQQWGVESYGGLIFWMGLRGVAGVVMAATGIWLWLRARLVEAALVVAMLPPDLSSFYLRALCGRPRPDPALVEVVGGPQGFSYPSGTALHAMFFYGFLLFLLPRLTASRRVRALAGIALAGWILIQGAWVIHHGRHWASDVVGGYLYGATFLAVWILIYPHAVAWHARRPAALGTLDRWLRRAVGLGPRGGP